MANEKKVSLSPEVQALSDKIVKTLSVDKETGAGSTDEKDLFGSNLPESLTIDTVKAVNNYTRDFVAASTHAAGIVSLEAMAGSKKLEQTSFNIGLEGRDHVEMVFKRSEVINNPMTKTEATHYCNPTVKITTRAGKSSSQLKNAVKLIREAAAAKLS